MTTSKHRVAISITDGYVPGLDAAIAGVVLSASHLGWEVVGIHDGFDGLLCPGQYPDGGILPIPPESVAHETSGVAARLGTTGRLNPFRVRQVNADNYVEELDRSDELIGAIQDRGVDGVIVVAGKRGLSTLFRLDRKGLKTVCIPTSVENDIAATLLSFGFNSALSFATETLTRARQAAESARKIGVVEVLGEHAGWLALQSGIAACADAVLIPEIPYDLRNIAAKLRDKLNAGRAYGLVVVAEGALPREGQHPAAEKVTQDSIRTSLSPGATGQGGSHVIEGSGRAAQAVALGLQRLTDQETYPLVLGQLVKGGPSSAVDRQLGLGYGAAAVRALHANQSGVMVAFQPPDLKFVPLAEAVNRIRTVPADSLFVQTARSLDISLGEGEVKP
jgi:6-phosphofructokinase